MNELTILLSREYILLDESIENGLFVGRTNVMQ